MQQETYSLLSFFAAGTPLKWISHTFWLKPLKPAFCTSKSKFPFNVKKKYQRFYAKGRPYD
jgi:hypothetical protein